MQSMLPLSLKGGGTTAAFTTNVMDNNISHRSALGGTSSDSRRRTETFSGSYSVFLLSSVSVLTTTFSHITSKKNKVFKYLVIAS